MPEITPAAELTSPGGNPLTLKLCGALVAARAKGVIACPTVTLRLEPLVMLESAPTVSASVVVAPVPLLFVALSATE